MFEEFAVNSVGKGASTTRLKSKTFVLQYLRHKSSKTQLCIGQIEPSTSLRGIPRAFDTFAVPGRREFDYQRVPGGGEFYSHAYGVGVKTVASISCEISVRFACGELSWRTQCWRIFVEKIDWLPGKGLNKLCAVFEGIWILIFLILDSGFEYMNVLSCVYNETGDSINKLNRGQLHVLWRAACMSVKWSWIRISHVRNVVISVRGTFFIERLVCCMTHGEKLSIQWPCSSDFRRFAPEFCS